MQGSRTDIEVIALFAQTKTNKEIDGNANASREKHHQGLYRLGVLEALNSLPENDQGNDNKGHRIDECSKNTQAMIAKCFMRVGRSFRLNSGTPGQAKREDISNDVTGI